MSAPYVLGADLTVCAAAELQASLLAQLQQSNELVVDGHAVSEVDGAGIQILLAAHKEALQCGGSLKLISPSQVLTDALRLIDLPHEGVISPEVNQECTA